MGHMFSNNLFHEQLHLMHYINIISSSKTNLNEMHFKPIALFLISQRNVIVIQTWVNEITRNSYSIN